MIDTQNLAEELKSRSGAAHVGPYLLRRELGRGGMSVVYEARDTRTGGEAALKLLSVPPTFAAEEAGRLVARFEREARTMARLSHPNVVEVYEVGAADGRHFLAMEYLRGQTLRDRLKQSKLTLGETFAILTQVAGAMDAVHAAGIVHRDIKAANVMLLPDGTAKLLDFGIARSSEEATITNAVAVIGTPAYMAPEQVRGEAASVATDLWSLSVLAYEMFAGHPPFGGPIVANVLFQVTSRPPVPAPHLPKSLGKVLRRALDKNVARRYPTAAALVQAVKSALPKSALPKSPLPKQTPVPAGPAASRLLSAPRWAQGAVLLLLFAGGFAVTAHERHSVQAAAVNPVSVSARPVPPPAAALPPPVILAPPSAPPAAGPYWVKPEMPQAAPPRPDKPSQASRVDLAAPPLHSPPADAGTEGDSSRAAQADETPRSRRSADFSAESAASRQSSGESSQSESSQSVASGMQRGGAPPSQMSVQASGQDQGQPPYQAQPQYQAAPQAPAQSAPQAATLPDSGNGSDDPEAAARLRKRGWSQSGDAPGQ